MNLLARARGLQEGIRLPVPESAEMPLHMGGSVRFKSSRSGTRRIAPASSHILPPALGEGDIDLPLPNIEH